MASAAALRPLWLAGIVDSKGRRPVTTDSFLLSRVATVSSQPVNGAFHLFIGNVGKLTDYFSHEADRFGSAAFESLLRKV